MADKQSKTKKSCAEVKAEIEKREARRRQQALKDEMTLLKAENADLKDQLEQRKDYAQKYEDCSITFNKIANLINKRNLDELGNDKLKSLIRYIENNLNELANKTADKNN